LRPKPLPVLQELEPEGQRGRYSDDQGEPVYRVVHDGILFGGNRDPDFRELPPEHHVGALSGLLE
jgi:hypothetical protein